MFSWLSRFTQTGPARAGSAARQHKTTQPPPAPPALPEPPVTANTQTPKLSIWAWLLNTPPPQPGPLRDAEQALVATVQAMLALDTLPDNLVPRASAVIPQLLRALRQDDGSRKEVVERIGKDQLLTAEVLRLVRSPFYRTQQAVESLDAAVSLIGTAGVHSAIARVVLKPMFTQAQHGLVAAASARTWQFAERQGEVCAHLATQAGLDWFDGFMAGTLHGVGRTALLKILDTHAPAPDSLWPCSQAWDDALSTLANQLFCKLAVQWNIAPPLTVAAQNVLAPHPATDRRVLELAQIWQASEQETLDRFVKNSVLNNY